MNSMIQKWVSEYNTIQDAADALGVSKSTISCWIRGVRNPKYFHCLKIERLTNGRYMACDLRPDIGKALED